MPVIVVNLPSDGDNAIAANVDDPINAILAVVNGNLDDDNIASMSGTKILAGTLPLTALSGSAIQGWSPLSASPNTISYLGNRSYQLTFNSLDLTGIASPGMRLKGVRTVSAPTQCTLLNGSSQYFVKTSPNKLTFTDDFVGSAWVKLNSYTGSSAIIASRYNGTSGWWLYVDLNGCLGIIGFNGGSGNYSQITSRQSVPLNKWVHVAAQLDMSAFTNTSTTSYVMIDGVDVSCLVARGGSNPTALIQAGNLEIGSTNGGTSLFPGKIAQVAIYNNKVSQTTMTASISQGLAGTETSLSSAYSFNNVITDLNTSTPNDLTAQASATATTVDNPFSDDTVGSTTYSIITSVAFSTNTTMVVQVPEGASLPTAGGLTASYFSSQKVPFGFPAGIDKWRIESLTRTVQTIASPTTSTWYFANSSLSIPIGSWRIGWSGFVESSLGGAGVFTTFATLSTANNSETTTNLTGGVYGGSNATTTGQVVGAGVERSICLDLSSATPYYLNLKTNIGATTLAFDGSSEATKIFAECGYL